MRRVRITRVRRPRRTPAEILALDPRDLDVLRAKALDARRREAGR